MLYKVARFFFRVLLRVVFRMEVSGIENCPREGPVIAVANHVSMLDPIVLGCALPRPVYFMAKHELFRNPLFAWALRHVGAFPVRRGEQDQKAFKRSLELLHEGKVLGMFPEGTRSPDGIIRRAFSGASVISLKTGAPVLPVGIVGTLRPVKRINGRLAFSRIKVRIGEILRFSDDSKEGASGGTPGDYNAKILDALRELVRD